MRNKKISLPVTKDMQVFKIILELACNKHEWLHWKSVSQDLKKKK